MRDVSAALAALSETARLALAHALVLALEGKTAETAEPREIGKDLRRASPALVQGGEAVPAAETDGAASGKSPALPVETALLRRRAAGEPGSRLYGGAAPSAVEIAPKPGPGVTVTYGSEGKAVTLRREPGGVSPEATEQTPGIARAPVEEGEKMREISRYFCRDSRRYDPGFTRY